jgi:hypothetical protein
MAGKSNNNTSLVSSQQREHASPTGAHAETSRNERGFLWVAFCAASYNRALYIAQRRRHTHALVRVPRTKSH